VKVSLPRVTHPLKSPSQEGEGRVTHPLKSPSSEGETAHPHNFPSEEGRAWTFLHYLNGDNNLRESVTANLAELHRQGSSDQVQVVASLYRGEPEFTWRNLMSFLRGDTGKSVALASASDWRGRKTFEVRQETSPAESSSPLIADYAAGECRPSDWKNLRDFLVQSITAYPARHYALFVSSHGAGKQGLLTDAQGRRMSVDDFQRALDEAQHITGQSIAMLALESCSMGEKSVMQRLQKSVGAIVASDIPITASQVDHARLLVEAKRNPHWTPEQLARATLTVYQENVPSMQLFA